MWCSDKGEVGPGCMSDQLIGQWWAHQLGLGYLLPREMVVSALRSIFKYNFKSDLTGWKHMPRAFAGAKDKGLIVCTWPKGGRPANVMLYADEVWTGIEYQVASHMIYEGLLEEGLSVARGRATVMTACPGLPSSAIPGAKSNAAAIMRAPCLPGRCSWPFRVIITTARRARYVFRHDTTQMISNPSFARPISQDNARAAARRCAISRSRPCIRTTAAASL